jgi:hypothetical protein
VTVEGTERSYPTSVAARVTCCHRGGRLETLQL